MSRTVDDAGLAATLRRFAAVVAPTRERGSAAVARRRLIGLLAHDSGVEIGLERSVAAAVADAASVDVDAVRVKAKFGPAGIAVSVSLLVPVGSGRR